MRFAAIATAGRRLASPTTAIRLIIRPFASAPACLPEQSASWRPWAHSNRSDLESRRRTALRMFDRSFGSESSSSTESEKSPSPASPNPPCSSQSSKSFNRKVLDSKKLFTFYLPSHFSTHIPVEWIKLYGDIDETAVAKESFQVSLSSGLAVLMKQRKCGLAFEHPNDLTMWRVNAFSEFEIAAGAKMITASEFHINIDFYYFALVIEYCLLEFGGKVPLKIKCILEKMKSWELNKGYSILVDPSLIPLQHWASAFLDVFHLITHTMSKEERTTFLSDLAPYCKSWHKDMIKNPLLRCFVIYSRSDGTFAKRDKNCPLAFLECIRHALSHPLDYLKLMWILGLGVYTKSDLHLLLQEKGGDELMSNICNLLPAKYRKDLSLERYLCREGSSCCPLPTICLRRRFKDEPSSLAGFKQELQMIFVQTSVNESLFNENAFLDDWKLLYSETVSAKSQTAESGVSTAQGFWSMIDSTSYSIWLCNREGDLRVSNKHEALNIICGLLQQMYACRKYSFGKMVVTGSSDRPFKMKGFWVFPGVKVPEFLFDLNGMEKYNWIRVNITSEKERELVTSILNENPVDEEPVVAAAFL